jgi:hypothetical protein
VYFHLKLIQAVLTHILAINIEMISQGESASSRSVCLRRELSCIGIGLTRYIGASEINISCVIWERDADRALNVVHTNLFTFLE